MRRRMAFDLHSPSGAEPPRPAPFAKGRVYRRFGAGPRAPRGIVGSGSARSGGTASLRRERHRHRGRRFARLYAPHDPRAWPSGSHGYSRRHGLHGFGQRDGALGREIGSIMSQDTGDDVSVSRAVAGLIFTPYVLPDPERPGAFLYGPRGDILLFGGDTAYPVATADEIRDRVIAPFNQVLAQREDGQRRVLLGIPGNHDWYDGLDGFGRMFRRHVDYAHDGKARPTLHGSSRTLLGHYAEWAREFVRGGQVEKPKTLDLIGYTAVQAASYFVLPLAPNLSVFAVDRQLKHVDSRQQHFFSSWLNRHLAAARG